MRKLLALLIITTFFIQCKRAIPEIEKEVGLVTDKAMVVTARKEASKIGVDILKKGGTAFDAMIATDLALVVAYPFSGNVTGGGFMVLQNQ